jgi:exodeoxyribonuclease VII small subunit
VTEEDFSWSDLPPEGELKREEQQAPLAADVTAMSFEQALGELESIVQDLERGELDLDAAIRAYERGTQLRLHCEGKLKEARLRVERITLGDGGRVSSEPAEFG